MSADAALRAFRDPHVPRVLSSAAKVAPATKPVGAAARSSLMLLIVALTLTAGFLAVYAVPDAPLFMTCSALLAGAGVCFVVLHRPGETLIPAKVASLLYIASFSYAPLWLSRRGIFHIAYFGAEVGDLIGRASLVALTGYLAFLGGYFLLLRWRRPTQRVHGDQRLPAAASQHGPALLCALFMATIGSVCYVKLVLATGGLGHLLTYSGGRADILSGAYGGWFWGAHLLFAAYGLFAVAAVRRHPWLCLLLALALAAVFVPLQGRDIVVGPIFCWLVFYHVLRAPLRWRTVVVGSLALVLIAALLDAYRHGGNRLALQDADDFVSSFFENAGRHMTTVVSANIDQLPSVAIAVRYVELEGQTIGPAGLLSWIAPVDRQFLGGSIPWIYTGVFMDLLVNPQHRGWNTALSPSLPGELYLCLGWLGVVAGMLLYGGAFGLLTVWGDRWTMKPLLFAAYPFVVYMAAKMVVDGTTHAFRPMIVYLAALACASFIPVPRLGRERVAVPR